MIMISVERAHLINTAIRLDLRHLGQGQDPDPDALEKVDPDPDTISSLSTKLSSWQGCIVRNCVNQLYSFWARI
jgi:hypothetical protein